VRFEDSEAKISIVALKFTTKSWSVCSLRPRPPVTSESPFTSRLRSCGSVPRNASLTIAAPRSAAGAAREARFSDSAPVLPFTIGGNVAAETGPGFSVNAPP